MTQAGGAQADPCERGSFRPAFGLIAVDWETFERCPRPSADRLGSLGRTRELPGRPV
ncbi:hypothetical protein [Streptomyces albidoflavus]|uniref:hypothetical protein n=1 Tax=Streptomyces albidoflavus TaxID=1886 RepID=UPI00031792D2